MKHKMWSRLLSMVLAVMMITSIVPNSAFAEAASEIAASSQATSEVRVEEVPLPEDTTTEEPAAETPAEEPAAETPAEEPAGEPAPTAEPVAEPSTEPAVESEQPTAEPSQAPAETAVPSEQPSAEPSAAPEGTETPEGTAVPSETPAASATPAPSESPVPSETPAPTETPAPSEEPAIDGQALLDELMAIEDDEAFMKAVNELTEEQTAALESLGEEALAEYTLRVESLTAQEETVELNAEAKEFTTAVEGVDGVTVTVNMPAGALPVDAKLQAKLIEEETEGYKQAKAALEEQEADQDGMIVLDIRFELNGEEVEPAHPVQVKIVANNILPEDADPATVAVQHLKENEDGTVTVENVAVAETVDEDTVQADMPAMMAAAPAEEQAGEAQPAEEPGIVTADGSELIAEFTVESFSLFTVTWSNKSITVKYVDANNVNQEVSIPNAPDGPVWANSSVSLDEYKKYAIDAGYEVESVQVYDDDGDLRTDDISDIGYYYSKNGGYKFQYKDEDNWKDFRSGYVLKILCSKSVEHTPVKTVDSYGQGVELYMVDFDSSTTSEMGVSSGYNSSTGGRTAGLVQSTLNKDGFPVSAGKGSNAGKAGTELSQWFDPQKNENMKAVNNLFLESVYNDTGYYYYNSSENFATIKGQPSKEYSEGVHLTDFAVYEDLGSPKSEEKFFYQRGNFLPFNTLGDKVINYNYYDYLGNKLTQNDSRYEEPLYGVAESSVNYYFGMYMTAQFVYPKGGKVEGQDMVFEFTGDDDLWVFIDGKLILDLGGKHDALTGKINFATGQVTIQTATEPATSGGSTTETFSLWDNKYFGQGFTAYTKHTIKMFYMESGAGASNLRIKFNLPTIPSNSLDVTKNLQGTDNKELNEYLQQTMTYRFQVLNADGKTLRIKKGDQYEIWEGSKKAGTGSVNEDGIFTLKAGQTARFVGMFPADSEPYIVRELIPDGASGQYGDIIYNVSGEGESVITKDEVGNIGSINFDGYSTGSINPADGSATVVYTNKVKLDAMKWTMLKITKTLEDNQQAASNDVFKMYVTLNEEPLAVGTQYTVGNETKAVSQDAPGVIELKAGQSATLPILADVNFKVVEQPLDGQKYQFVQYRYGKKTEYTQTNGIDGYADAAGGEDEGVKTYEVIVTNRRLKGDLVISKTIVGGENLTSDQLNQIKNGLEFEVKDQNNTLVEVNGNTTGRYQLNWSTEDPLTGTITLNNLEAGTYTVTEYISNTPTTVTCTTTVKVTGNDTAVTGTQASGELEEGYNILTFDFTNTYAPANGTLKIHKDLKDDNGNSIDPLGGGKDVFSFKITDKDGKTWYMHVNSTGDATVDGTKTELKLPAGKYIVTELKNLNYDSSKTKVKVNNSAEETNTAVEVTISGGETLVTFTNTPKTDPGITDGSGVINKFTQNQDGTITITGVPVKKENDTSDDTVVKGNPEPSGN